MLQRRQRRRLVQGGIEVATCEQRHSPEEERRATVQSRYTRAPPALPTTHHTEMRGFVLRAVSRETWRLGGDWNGLAATSPRARTLLQVTPTPLEPSRRT